MRRIQMWTIEAELVIHCRLKTGFIAGDAFANASLGFLRHALLDHPSTSLSFERLKPGMTAHARLPSSIR